MNSSDKCDTTIEIHFIHFPLVLLLGRFIFFQCNAVLFTPSTIAVKIN